MIPRLRHALLLVAILPAVPATAAPTPEQADFGERLLDTASSFASNPIGVPAAGAMSDAALKLIGNDPRLLRLAIDLQLRLGRADKATALLDEYRRIDSTDQLAQVQAIDLYINRMQSTDAREAYLRKIISVEAVPADVRSHGAVQLATVLRERGVDDEADRALDDALKLNPSNPRALQMAVDRAFAGAGGARERSAALVNLLKGNPMQPASIAVLAEELARAGATEQGVAMYKKAFEMNRAMNSAPSAADVINGAALMLGAGQAKEAATAANNATQLDPTLSRGWFMRLLIEKQNGDAKAFETVLGDARLAMTRNLMYLHTLVDEKAPRVTGETKPVLPDVRADAAAIKADPKHRRVAWMYLGALGDLAWLEVYFSGKAPDPAIMDAMATLDGEQSVLVARIAGFAAIAAGDDDAAKIKLSAIGDRDSMAKLGLLAVRLKEGEAKDAIAKEGSTLLSSVPVDVWSAMVRYTLREAGDLSFRTADADAVIAEAAKLPDRWLKLPTEANMFYLADLVPITSNVTSGEPVLMKLTVQNTSDYPLVLGPGGVIDQRVIIDVTARGPSEQYFPGTAAARLTGRLVLQPRQSVTTTVRVDAPVVGAFMDAWANVSLAIYGSAVFNPRIGRDAISPGPGGFRVQARAAIDRPAAPLAKEAVRQDLAKRLQSTDAVQRLRAMRTIYGNIQSLRGEEKPTDEQKQLGDAGMSMLQKAVETESSSTVRALGQEMLANLQSAEVREAVIKTMLASADWESRLLGSLMATNLPPARRTELLTPLAEKDADESVKALAKAIAALPAPATQPVTQPGQ